MAITQLAKDVSYRQNVYLFQNKIVNMQINIFVIDKQHTA